MPSTLSDGPVLNGPLVAVAYRLHAMALLEAGFRDTAERLGQVAVLYSLLLLDGIAGADDVAAKAEPIGEGVVGFDLGGGRVDAAPELGVEIYSSRKIVRTTRPSSRKAR